MKSAVDAPFKLDANEHVYDKRTDSETVVQCLHTHVDLCASTATQTGTGNCHIHYIPDRKHKLCFLLFMLFINYVNYCWQYFVELLCFVSLLIS